MLFALPDHDTLYEALVARDPSYEGRAYVGVTTTGVFCRLTCTARKPMRDHCRFFTSVASCIEAGFRPCKRCHPLAPAAKAIWRCGRFSTHSNKSPSAAGQRAMSLRSGSIPPACAAASGGTSA
jgi:methylphosphotriester-DNA--protein-cysteine methyltransferase